MRTLTNGCTNPLLPEWEDHAWAHEVVFSSTQWSKLSANWLEIVEGLTVFGVAAGDLAALNRGEFLCVEFGYLGAGDTYIAVLSTAADLVVITEDTEDGVDLQGLMTHQGFWDYLGSFPNIYKHLKVGNGREKYWQRVTQ